MKLKALLLFLLLLAPGSVFAQPLTEAGVEIASFYGLQPQIVQLPLSSTSAQITTVVSVVPENLETALIYVDPNGNDGNSGTQSKPLKTLQAAVKIAFNNNKKNIGTRVIVNPGTYRESAQYNAGAGNTAAPVTFQALTNGTVILAGSDIYTGWKLSGDVFTHSWTSLGGACRSPNGWPNMWPIARRREMVFVNGTPLTQVISSGEMVEGTFYVDDTGGQISVWPPSGTNMSTATVEVAVRPGVFTLSGATNFVFRGLTFEHAATCPQAGNALTINNSTNVLVDTDKFLWNNQSGLGFFRTSNVLVQNSVANHNGGIGLAADEGKNLAFNANETLYNNWRAAMAAYYGWAYAGAKFLLLHEASFNGWKSYYNQTGGVWFDTDNANVSIQSLNSSNNLTYGMFLEANVGPISITNSRFCNNQDNEVPTSSFGPLIGANSEFVTVSSTLFYNNIVPAGGGGQILIAGAASGRIVTNWETGQTYTVQSQNWTLSGDTVVGVGSGQNLFYSYLPGSVWNLFQSTFSSNNNTWWNPSNAHVFKTSAGDFNFARWKSAMRQDGDSTFSDPASSCPAPTPDAPDYWLSTYFGGNVKTVSRGSNAVYTIQVTPVGAFSDTVTLSADGLAEVGATSSFGSSSINTSGSTTLTVSTTGSTTVGTFPITVIASSRGVVRTVTLTLVVN